MGDTKVTSQTIIIEKDKGITQALKKHVNELPNSILSDGYISNQEWFNTLDKLIELNNKRIENGKTPIFKGGTDKLRTGWHTSFIVEPEQKIVFLEDEIKELYKAMGVSFKSKVETPVGEGNHPENKDNSETTPPAIEETPSNDDNNKNNSEDNNKEESVQAGASQTSSNNSVLKNLFYDGDKISCTKTGIALLIAAGTIFTGGKLLKYLKQAPKSSIAGEANISGAANADTKQSRFWSWFKRNKASSKTEPKQKLEVGNETKAEQERLAKEAEKKAEQERLAKEAEKKAEQERLAKEAEKKAEQERLAKEAEKKAEQERLAKEAEKKAEQERLAKEAEKKAEQERLAKEAEKKAEQERLAKEAEKKAEQERLAKEAEKKAEQSQVFENKPIVKPENYETATSESLIKEWERLGTVREHIDEVSQVKLHCQLGMDRSRIEDILMGTGHIQIKGKWMHINDIKYSESFGQSTMAELLEEYKGNSAEDLAKQFYYMLKEHPDLESLSSAYFQAPIKLLKQKGWNFKNGSWVKQENGQTIVIPQKIRGTKDRNFTNAMEFDSEKFKLVQTGDKQGTLLLKENELPQENILSGIGHEKTNQAYREGKIRVLNPADVEFKDGVWTVKKELEYIYEKGQSIAFSGNGEVLLGQKLAGQEVFFMNQTSPTVGTIELTSNESLANELLGMLSEFKNSIEVTNHVPVASSIKMVKPGRVELIDGKWVVKDKIQVKYE